MQPLKFNPIFKDKIWGGNKMKSLLGKDYGGLPNCGESWELSGVPGNVSVVSEGQWKGRDLNSLIAEFGEELVGKHNYRKYGNEFPLLVKFIDASQDLSIQVHPDDKLAGERHRSKGKTEMWYIIHSDPGSTLIAGFRKELDKKTYLDYLDRGEISDLLNVEIAEKDDVFYIPAGRVHNIGKGLLLAEIQQSSDITYRIYDFDRLDAQGKKRELHTELALDAIDFRAYENYKLRYDKSTRNKNQELVQSPFFTTNRLYYTGSFSRDFQEHDSFTIFTCLQGSGSISNGTTEVNISAGEVVLIPASNKKIGIKVDREIKLIETYIVQNGH
ncbi:MAG TPA: type I phosphomannose isomerase catalytic subunit [Cyclobacteriaceae bacterium]|nr:type I phosphomannose isomerase catalytic subunit [Cyclobacteriaceae bacterium]